MNRILLVVMALVVGCLQGRAESVDDWIATALAENPELAAAREKWQAAKQQVSLTRSLEDPVIGVDVERDTTRFDAYHANEWMISQKLPWFGKRGARGRVAALEAEVIGFRYLELLRDIRARVIEAQWDLWLAQRRVEIATENRDLVEQAAQVARARYETGQGTQADLLRAQIDLARMNNEVVTMEREVPVAVNALNRLLNAPPATPRHVAAPPRLSVITLSLEEMQTRARAYCCILMSFIRAREARAAVVRVARLESAPDVEFRVEARQFNGRSGIQEYDTGVFVNFPWLWRGKYQAMVRAAETEVAQADRELEEEINMTMLTVKELYTEADAAWRLVGLSDGQVLPQARQLVAATRAAYETGVATFRELLDAQQTLRDAQLEADRARARYGTAHAKLDAFIAPWGEHEFATGLVTPDMK